MADGFDRRLLVMAAEAATLLVSLGLIVNASLAAPTTWFLFVAAALSAAFDALRRPPLDALLPRLVEPGDMKSALALSSGLGSLAALIGPAIAGVAIASLGFAGAYAADALTFVVAVATIAAIHTPAGTSERSTPSLRSTLDAVRYASGRPELIGTYVVDINAMFFGMPLATFPALARHFGGGDSLVGILYAAPAAGAMLAAALERLVGRRSSTWPRDRGCRGRLGLRSSASGSPRALCLRWCSWCLAGAADEISGLFRAVIWNQTIPTAMRGRLAGLEMLSWSSGPTLGNTEAGVASALVGLRASIVLGGALCVAGGGVLAEAPAGLLGLRRARRRSRDPACRLVSRPRRAASPEALRPAAPRRRRRPAVLRVRPCRSSPTARRRRRSRPGPPGR